MNVVDPKHLPVRMPLWVTVLLWLIAAHFDYGTWPLIITGAIGVLLWARYVFLWGDQIRLPPSKITA